MRLKLMTTMAAAVAVTGAMAAQASVLPGDFAVNFTGQLADGSTADFYDYLGDIVVFEIAEMH